MNTKEKCKVVLLNPPTAAPSSEILLNLAYLSSVLKKEGHEVLILDGTAPYKKLNEKEIEKEIKKFQPNFIGVTITINYIPRTYEYLKRLRKLQIPIVAGGPHANCLPEEVLQNGADIVAIGEGEDTILELAEHFLGKKQLKNISGICFKKDNETPHYTNKRPLIQNLDRIPFPDYESFPIRNYAGSDDPDSNPLFWSIFSSRGCPYNCTYCSSHNVFGRTFRSRSPKNVIQEIEYLAENYGARFFAFQDDEAFIDKKRIIEFCNLVKKSKFDLKFSARLRIDGLEENMLKEMRSAKFKRLAFGIESFNDETLKKVNKMYKIEAITCGLKILKKVGSQKIHFNNIIGFPWETPQHLKDNLKEISKIDKSLIHFASSNPPIPYPKTVLYEDNYKKYGFENWWLNPKLNSPESKIDSFFMLFVSNQELLYRDDIFWNHSKEMKLALKKFSWKLAKNNLNQVFSFPMSNLIYLSLIISNYLWKENPRLEKIIFSPLCFLVKKFKLDKKAKFIYQS